MGSRQITPGDMGPPAAAETSLLARGPTPAPNARGDDKTPRTDRADVPAVKYESDPAGRNAIRHYNRVDKPATSASIASGGNGYLQSRMMHANVPLNQSEHRRIAGIEGSDHLYGPLPLKYFLYEGCFPGHRFAAMKSVMKKSFQDMLNGVRPGLRSSGKLCERSMYDPLVECFTSITNKAVPKSVLPIEFRNIADTRPAEMQGGYRSTPDICILRRLSESDDEGESVVNSKKMSGKVKTKGEAKGKGKEKESRRPKPPRTQEELVDDYWGCGLGFVEVKASEKADPFYQEDLTANEASQRTEEQVDTWNQIQEYAAIAFRNVPRTFLLAIGIFGDVARLFRWDRSSVMVSHCIRYKDDPKPLVEFIIGLANYANSGLDTSACMPVVDPAERTLVERSYQEALRLGLFEGPYKGLRGGLTLLSESSRMTIRSKEDAGAFHTVLTLGRPIFCSKSIVGRGTRVWIAKKVGSGEKEFLVVKDQWADDVGKRQYSM
ncbi:hypothetical protein GLOTRDRAFT_131163 [Gloeophyllum trabeum ATCC 11539]|uniref:Fungal-type protein kinase domain-containing protein n=1 Tax=Gloeophyllum trabeum (strain ATCC 11539 / FP-39264 / Madison 617) TaxID=670483 RepID=S7Q2T5_GLOTA|nr:uncharacterized protein GLOTRDRAFT_131163 [Gloeophyllum trabeum ATCC 11539]EPQ53833.1 hypothetical protein GLOTRDRAFT_131163 [Gloeophyllum trabeum ATCC 11539]